MVNNSRRSFLIGGVSAAVGAAGWYALKNSDEENGVQWPLRRVLEANATVSRALGSESSLAPVFPVERARIPRVTGDAGLDGSIDVSTWKLRVEGSGAPREFALADIQALPRIEMVTEHKCIEGWSEVIHWTGARFADFIRLCNPPAAAAYTGLETPDRGYYVGLEMASALHPQTLLCYQMNGQPLTSEHGAPLRLVVPIKYGIKSLKRIGKIRFASERPPDYWAEQGYDWHAGF